MTPDQADCPVPALWRGDRLGLVCGGGLAQEAVIGQIHAALAGILPDGVTAEIGPLVLVHERPREQERTDFSVFSSLLPLPVEDRAMSAAYPAKSTGHFQERRPGRTQPDVPRPRPGRQGRW